MGAIELRGQLQALAQMLEYPIGAMSVLGLKESGVPL